MCVYFYDEKGNFTMSRSIYYIYVDECQNEFLLG